MIVHGYMCCCYGWLSLLIAIFPSLLYFTFMHFHTGMCIFTATDRIADVIVLSVGSTLLLSGLVVQWQLG